MGGTTYSAIRQAQLSVLEQLVMTGLPAERLLVREDDNHPDFVAWADAAAGPLRRFDMAHGMDFGEERYLDTATSLEVHTVQVLVAYPAVRHLAAGDERIELEDLIEQDVEDIDRALGERGVGSYAELAAGLHRCALERAELVERPAARVLRMVFSIDYDRSMS